MKNLILVFVLLISFAAQASEKLMAMITSDVDQNTGYFYLVTSEDGQIDGVHVVITGSKGETVSDDFHLAERVMSEGVVIIEQNNRDAVRLEVEDFSVETGGTVIMDYLFNGVTGSRKQLKLKLFKSGGDYVLTDWNKTPVNRLFAIGNRVRVIGVIGIRTVEISFLQE